MFDIGGRTYEEDAPVLNYVIDLSRGFVILLCQLKYCWNT